MTDIQIEDIDNRYRFDVNDPHKRIFALAMQGLFEVEVGKIDPEVAAVDVVPGDCPEDIRNTVRQLVLGASVETAELDEVLSHHLTCNWSVERLGTIERNVLRLGIYIINHRIWSSYQHVRDLAANCTAEYSGDKSHSLVMGVLDAIGRAQQDK